MTQPELIQRGKPAYIQGRTVVHYITRWSGHPDDEATLCGEDSYHRTEAGRTHDSAGWSMNICERCAAIHFAEPESEMERRR